MKKLSVFSLALALAGFLIACGGSSNTPQTKNTPSGAVLGSSVKKLDIAGKSCPSDFSKLTSPDPAEEFVIVVCNQKVNGQFFGNGFEPPKTVELKFISFEQGQDGADNSAMFTYEVQAVDCDVCPRDYKGTIVLQKNLNQEWQLVSDPTIILLETKDSFVTAVERWVKIELPSTTVQITDANVTFDLPLKVVVGQDLVDLVFLQVQFSDGRVVEFQSNRQDDIRHFSPLGGGNLPTGGSGKVVAYAYEFSTPYGVNNTVKSDWIRVN